MLKEEEGLSTHTSLNSLLRLSWIRTKVRITTKAHASLMTLCPFVLALGKTGMSKRTGAGGGLLQRSEGYSIPAT